MEPQSVEQLNQELDNEETIPPEAITIESENCIIVNGVRYYRSHVEEVQESEDGIPPKFMKLKSESCFVYKGVKYCV